jgi:hypothetical protein
VSNKTKWEREEPVKRECYALYREHGVATVWTTFCTVTSHDEKWTKWDWDATVGGFCAEGLARSREEAEALAEHMLDALVAMAEQYDASREQETP